MAEQDSHERLLASLTNKQRSEWPNTIVNARSVDKLLWRGGGGLSRVQQIGIWLFGALWLGYGLVLLTMFSFHDYEFGAGSASIS